MPGNVQNATSTGTLPWSLSTSFTETREWPVLISSYRDGSSQRNSLAATSRKRYSFTKRLTASQLDTLRTFWLASIGKAFRVYTSKSDYDLANSNYKLMRFDGTWNEAASMVRTNVSIQMVELA